MVEAFAGAAGGYGSYMPSSEGGSNLPEMTDSLLMVSGPVGADVRFITSLGTGGR